MIVSDLSANSVFISSVVALVGWGLKEVIQTLIKKLIETIAKVEILDSKLEALVQTVGDVQKIRFDLNEYYKKLKDLEKKVSQPKH